MSKAPSIETQLKAAKRNASQARVLLHDTRIELGQVRSKLSKAESDVRYWTEEVAAWKRRFDALLAQRSTT